MLWLTVNSTYNWRLWQSTMTKKLKRREVSPTRTEPYDPQSTWAHSPGRKARVRNAFGFSGGPCGRNASESSSCRNNLLLGDFAISVLP